MTPEQQKLVNSKLYTRQPKGEPPVRVQPDGSAAAQLQPLVKELRALADGWRNSPTDPHNIANAVMVALLEVSNAIVRAYGEPPNAPDQR